MREYCINPKEILIIENLERYIEGDEHRFDEYIKNKNHDKKAIVTLNRNDELIALDGNKLCLISRVLGRNVKIVFLQSNDDYEKFNRNYDAEIYDSPLITDENKRKYTITPMFTDPYVDFFSKLNDDKTIILDKDKVDILEKYLLKRYADYISDLDFSEKAIFYTGMLEDTKKKLLEIK